MNRFLQTLIVAAPVVITTPYVAAETYPAQKQMQQNIDAVLRIARNTSLTEAQRVKQVKQYANRYLNHRRIPALAVDAPWRELFAKQKTDFVRAFEDVVIAICSHSALVDVADANVRLLPKMTADGNRFDILSEIQTKEGMKCEVVCQLCQSGGVYEIYNIRMDDTSLITVYRNQFGELIKNKGIDSTAATVTAKGLKKQ